MSVGTAGSISLALQAILLAAKNHKKRMTVDISGGTNVMWAPPVDSYQYLLFPLMKKMGISASVHIVNRGFYPQGGGRVIVTLDPIHNMLPMNIETLGDLIGIKGICFSQHLPDWIVKEIMKGCYDTLSPITNIDFDIQRGDEGSRGAGIVLVAKFENGMIGSNALTSSGYIADKIGKDAANNLLNEIHSGATMDVHTADQLLPYMAMSNGKSRFLVSRISKHLVSQMNILESFINVKFSVERKDNIYKFTVSPDDKNETIHSC